MRLFKTKRNEQARSASDAVLVRVAPEILDLLKNGQASPVVILGINEMDDGTHEMVLRSVERPSQQRLQTPSAGSVHRC